MMRKRFALFILLLLAGNLFAQKEIVYDFQSGKYVGTGQAIIEKMEAVPNNCILQYRITNINMFRYEVSIDGKNVDYFTQMSEELRTIFRQPTPTSTKVSQNVAAIQGAAADMKGLTDTSRAMGSPLSPVMKKLNEACQDYLETVKAIQGLELHRLELIQKMKTSRSRPTVEIKTRESLYAIYDSFLENYIRAESLYDAAQEQAKSAQTAAKKTDKESFKKSGDAIASAKEKLEEAHEAISKTDVLKLIGEVLLLQDGLAESRNFEVVSPPIQVDGADVLALTVKITPKSYGEFAPFEKETVMLAEIPVKGGMKIDFSVGPVFSFGNNSKDDLFYLEEGETEGTSILKKRKNGNDITPGMAAMMHVYWRSGRFFSIGGMFGVGAGFKGMEDADLSFYAGPSIVMGKSEKVMLNFGWSFFGVDRLKNGEFEVGNTYATDDIALSDVSEKVIKSSFFVSLSYNLSGRRER